MSPTMNSRHPSTCLFNQQLNRSPWLYTTHSLFPSFIVSISCYLSFLFPSFAFHLSQEVDCRKTSRQNSITFSSGVNNHNSQKTTRLLVAQNKGFPTLAVIVMFTHNRVLPDCLTGRFGRQVFVKLSTSLYLFLPLGSIFRAGYKERLTSKPMREDSCQIAVGAYSSI